MRLFKRNSSKHRASSSSAPDKLIVSPALPEDSCSDSRFAQGMGSGLFASMQETQAPQDHEGTQDYQGFQDYQRAQDYQGTQDYLNAQDYQNTSSVSDFDEQHDLANLPFARSANTPFTFIAPQKPAAQSVQYPSATTDFAANQQSGQQPGLQLAQQPEVDEVYANPQAQLFGSVASEKDSQVSLGQLFCVNEQDSDNTADLAARVGLGSACDDNFSFISESKLAETGRNDARQVGQVQTLAQSQANPSNFAQSDERADDGAYESTNSYDASAYAGASAMDSTVDSESGDIDAQAQAQSQFQFQAQAQAQVNANDQANGQVAATLDDAGQPQASSVADEAALLVANMILGRNPLANITADTNTDLDQNANLDFTHLDAEGNELQGASGNIPAMTVNLDEASAAVGSDNSVRESMSLADGEADNDSLNESASANGNGDGNGDGPADLELEDAKKEDDCLVNKRITEPKHKIELVEEDEPPRATYLDPESEHQAVLAEQREDATVQAFVGNVGHTPPQRPHFTLLRTQISLVDAPEKELEPNLLSEEQEANGDKADINDFVTGNITTLRTGTDDVAVAASSGGAASVVHDEEVDDSLEQPELTVEHVLEDGETLNISERKQYYTSTLPNLRGSTPSPKLLPAIALDMGRNFYVYILAILFGLLSLIKVYQVQDTRNLTAQLNEVTIDNEELDKEWLNLLATRQNLSEHAKIRSYATRQLEMVSPKTENEQVISLH